MVSTPLPCTEGAIRSEPADAPCTASQRPWILVATVLGSSIAFIDGSVVNVALPAVQADLGASAAQAQWVVVSYTLVLASLMLLGGTLGDRYGRRRIFASGVAIFAAGAVWCGLAPTIELLIMGRVIQGVGGALLVPGSLALIGASFTEEQRGAAIGTWSAFTAIAAGIGPLIGGWLIENVSWRGAFVMTVPLAAVVIVVLYGKVPESRAETVAGPLDWPGALLAALGLGSLIYGLTELSSRGLGVAPVLVGLALGVVLLGAFIVVELRSPAPMMPLTLFRSRSFSGANLLTVLLYGAMTAATYYIPFNLIQVQGYGATAAGAALLPFVVLLFVLSRWSGGLVSSVGAKLPLVVGPMIAAAGIALLAVPGVGAGYWTTFFPAIAVLGLGMAISAAPLTTTVLNAVDARFSGTASGINNTASRATGAIAIAALSIIMAATFDMRLDENLDQLAVPPATHAWMDSQRANLAAAEMPPDSDPETQAALEGAVDDAFVAGFRVIALVSAALALAGALVAALMIQGRPAPARVALDQRLPAAEAPSG